jgi:hypothetical protein
VPLDDSKDRGSEGEKLDRLPAVIFVDLRPGDRVSEGLNDRPSFVVGHAEALGHLSRVRLGKPGRLDHAVLDVRHREKHDDGRQLVFPLGCGRLLPAERLRVDRRKLPDDLRGGALLSLRLCSTGRAAARLWTMVLAFVRA